MPVDVIPLFRPDVLAPRVAAFALPVATDELQARLKRWATLLSGAGTAKYKETELLADFLTDVFVEGLGYRPPVARDAAGAYTLSREAWVEADGKVADAVLGRFADGGVGAGRDYVVAVEGKGPRDPLDRPFAGRRISAVDQAYRYAINLPCDWALVTNCRELRLYHKGSTQRTYERWDVAAMAADRRALARFVYVLGAERVLPATGRSHLYELLAESAAAGERLTQAFYAEYSGVRRDVLAALRRDNPAVAPEAVLEATQRLLDRALFVAFAEDRGLLPADTLAKAFEHRDPYNPRPVWENFRGLFRAVDQGSTALNVPRYNGGLFAEDPVLDRTLAVSDAVCRRVAELGRYDYRLPNTTEPDAAGSVPPLVDVEILGHIFEQSISDLEALRATLAPAARAADPKTATGPAESASPEAGRHGGGIAGAAASRRRREGAFYTQRFLTRYLVQQALGPVLARRFDGLRARQEAAARAKEPKGTGWRALGDPRAYVTERLNEPQRAALVGFWEAWLTELQTVRVLDPACGSGAFLIEAFDQLHAEYDRATGTLEELRPQGLGLFDPDRTILQQNLFGVDLNAEAVDIARLSVWIKTAQRGKVLTDLDRNVRVGNSVVGDSTLDARAFDWTRAFGALLGSAGEPEARRAAEVTDGRADTRTGMPAAGLFDVVVGNPPYVRAELLGRHKEHWKARFATYHGSADLYVYFYELGLRLLKPGGRLAYVVTNKWLKAGYAEALRRYLAEDVWLDEVVDLGHARQVFPDADVFPSLLVAERPTAGAAPPAAVRAAVIPREVLRPEELADQVTTGAYSIARTRFGPSPWTLDPPEADALAEKLRRVGVPLPEFLGVASQYGIKTGFNEAFLVDTPTRDALVREDPCSAEILKPCLRGQEVTRWAPEWGGEWMIFARRGIDITRYPAVLRHLERFRTRLEPRPADWPSRMPDDHWPGRKPGRYAWYELQDSVDYFESFERPKLLHTDIAWGPAFAYAAGPLYPLNTVYVWPSDDLYALGVLNSPLLWWYTWRHAQHGKDDALRLFSTYTATIPIARPTDVLRARVEDGVRALVALRGEQTEQRAALLDWLRVEFGVQRPGERLATFDALTPDEFVAEVKRRQAGSGALSPAALRRLRDAYRDAVGPLATAATEVALRELAMSGAVMAAYRLTAEEIALVWRTAPPRMPLGNDVMGAG